jgi:hypothetical protein
MMRSQLPTPYFSAVTLSFKALLITCFLCLITLCSTLIAPAAYAMVPVEVKDLTTELCPPEMSEGIVNAGDVSKASCYLIKGTAINKSGKPVLNTDIFGLVFDANDDPVMQNRSRLGAIDEVPPGESKFSIRITVAANQPAPLKLKNFKASGFAGKVRR